LLGVDNYVGPFVCLTARDVRRLLRMVDAGANRDDIADTLGVSRRTVQRYYRAQVASVIVGDWRLTFLLRPGRVPSLIERLHIR
jgi:response regulator of citrate/malate metabolism